MKNNSKIIADTCVWIEFFRSKSEISNRLKELISNNLVIGTGRVIPVPADAAKLDMVFHNLTDGSWDNNSGADWHFDVQ